VISSTLKVGEFCALVGVLLLLERMMRVLVLQDAVLSLGFEEQIIGLAQPAANLPAHVHLYHGELF